MVNKTDKTETNPAEENYNGIGARLLEERKRLHLTGKDVAKLLEVHDNTYRNYENGRRDMHSEILVKLDKAKFDVNYLLFSKRKGGK